MSRIIRSDVDGVANRHTAGKLELAVGDECPFAVGCRPPVQRMSAHNGERTAAPIRCEPSDGLIRKLLYAFIAGDCEEPVAPGRHKYRRFRHESPAFSQRSLNRDSPAKWRGMSAGLLARAPPPTRANTPHQHRKFQALSHPHGIWYKGQCPPPYPRAATNHVFAAPQVTEPGPDRPLHKTSALRQRSLHW